MWMFRRVSFSIRIAGVDFFGRNIPRGLLRRP
jgi:hypothetical protein